MRYFGKRHHAPIYEQIESAPTPVGMACAHCNEPIEANDDGFLIPLFGEVPSELPYHWECHLRLIVGCVEHQRRLEAGLGCDATCCDDPALTVRNAARAAGQYAGFIKP